MVVPGQLGLMLLAMILAGISPKLMGVGAIQIAGLF